jgi:hypothetical protein
MANMGRLDVSRRLQLLTCAYQEEMVLCP